nr:alpha/beta fold hydrolase [Bogoriella caseilytica]
MNNENVTQHSAADAPPTPFHDLDAYTALPRLGGLSLSPDGTRLIAGVATLDKEPAEATRYRTALWEIDPVGERAPRRLTRGAKGESQPVFTPEGDLLFVAARDEDEPAALWAVPATGGEARCVASHPGGVSAVHVAAQSGTVVIQAQALHGAADLEEDKQVRKERKDKKVSAILHEDYGVRFWDHDLGPGSARLYAATLDAAVVAGPDDAAEHEGSAELRDLTPDARRQNLSCAVSADGSFLVSTWRVHEGRASTRTDLVRIDAATGERRVLLRADETYDFGAPTISPDGATLVYTRSRRSTPELAPQPELWSMDLDSGSTRRLAGDLDLWLSAGSPQAWLPDSSRLLATADANGRGAIIEINPADGTARRLSLSDPDATYTDVIAAPDGVSAYALRTSYASPSEPVRIDLASGEVSALRSPAPRPALPGSLTEVETTTADGTRVRAWLCLPQGASADEPAPLLLWIHGGPLNSWNAWSWRWCPWIMVARGYAVLLPDPALSTGYGQDFIQRGWGSWGAAPYTDLMAITDATEARSDIDDSRTAAMGGSFGGYMANWVAGHTDRFDAIVTHASLWALDQFGPTTDAAAYWSREISPEMVAEHSPHLSVEEIRTPVLVVHGDKDYRVPIGEGLRLWYELLSASGLPQDEDGSTVHRFLYFPDENHWVLTPQHSKIWYDVILDFLSRHVLQEDSGELPRLLG